MEEENVHIEYKPDHYVGPFVSITIHVRRKDVGKANMETLKRRLELDISTMNSMDSKNFI